MVAINKISLLITLGFMATFLSYGCLATYGPEHEDGPVDLMPQDNTGGAEGFPHDAPLDSYSEETPPPTIQQPLNAQPQQFPLHQQALPTRPIAKPIPIQPSPVFGTAEPMALGNSRETLEQKAGQCEQQVTDLRQQRSQIPHQQLKNFDIALGIALEQCRTLKEEVAAFKKADDALAKYQAELQKAQQAQ